MKKIEWLDFKGCHECQGLNQGFRGVVESIAYVLLVFCVLGIAYFACSEESQLKPSFSPAAEVEDADLRRVKG